MPIDKFGRDISGDTTNYYGGGGGGINVAQLDNAVNSRVAKAGDSMTGDLAMSVGTGTSRQITCDGELYIKGTTGILASVNGIEVLRLNSNSLTSYYDLSMNNKNIKFLADPSYDSDAVPMSYVNNYIPKLRDYITPLLTSATVPTGYTITASS